MNAGPMIVAPGRIVVGEFQCGPVDPNQPPAIGIARILFEHQPGVVAPPQAGHFGVGPPNALEEMKQRFARGVDVEFEE